MTCTDRNAVTTQQMRFKVMSIKTLLLAGVLSLAATSAASATDGPPPGNGGSNGHASAAPACGDQCPVLAEDTGPGSPGDHNGRSSAALSQGGGAFRVAGGRGSIGGDV